MYAAFRVTDVGAVWKELLLSIFISLNPLHRKKVPTLAFILKLEDVIHGNISLNDFMPGKTKTKGIHQSRLKSGNKTEKLVYCHVGVLLCQY